MTTNRALLSLAVLLALPTSAAAQRFAGVIDATGMLPRPAASPTAMPIPGLPMMLASGTVLMAPPAAGFFTPATVPQIAPADAMALNQVVQPVFIPVPVATAPSDITEQELLNAELAAAQRDARVLSPRSAAFLARGMTDITPPIAAPTSGSASGRCQASALRQLRASNVRADNLSFGPTSVTWSTPNETAVVRGSGVLVDAVLGQRRFNYVCDYKVPPAQTRAVVRLQ